MLTPTAHRALRAYLRAVAFAEPVTLALLNKHGITLAELRAVRILRDLGQVPISRFADALGISRSTATGLVDRLEERGLVAREPGTHDRRVVLISTTPRGRQALDNRALLDESILAQRIAALTPEKQRQFADIVGLITGEAVPDESGSRAVEGSGSRPAAAEAEPVGSRR